MSNLGDTLRQQRESRKITLDMIAAATKIGKRYLLAIEAGEYGDLPGSVFNKGYVREYAKFVGLDPEQMVSAYVQEEQVWQQEATDPVVELSRKLEQEGLVERSSPGFRPMRIVVPVLAVALVGVATWFLFFRGDRVVETQTAAGMTETAPTEVAQSEELPAPGPRDTDRPRAQAPTSEADRTAEPVIEPPLPSAAEVDERAAVSDTPIVAETKPPVRAERQSEPAPPTKTAPVEAEPVTESSSRAAADAAALSIDQFGVGTRVVNRRLQGENDRFEEGTQVWFWTRVLGGEPGESIRHVWLHEGREITSTELTLGGPHWRTQSRKTLYAGSSPGSWTVEARDSDGRILARDRFTCVPRGS